MSPFILALGLLVGCDGDSPYLVGVTLNGDPGAFSNRVVFVGGKQVASPNGVGGYVELCTQSKDKFLNAEVPLAVKQDETTTYSGTLRRYACALAENSGHMEMNYLFLQRDGILLHDITAGDVRVWASCLSSGTHPMCSGDDL